MRQKALVLVLVASIICGFTGVYWYNRSQSVLSGFEVTLADELTKALGSDVSIGKMELASYNKILLRNVTIRDRSGGLIAVDDKITVAFSPLALLREVSAASAVQELTLEKPQLYLTRKIDGKWNVSDLLANQSGESSFGGKITLEDGAVEVKTPEGRWLINAISGSADFGHRPAIAVDFAALYSGSPVKLTGRINQQEISFLEARASGFALEDFQSLLPSTQKVKLLGGKVANLEIAIRSDHNGLTYSGEAKLDGVAAEIDGMSVREAKGLIGFSDKDIQFFGMDAKIFGQSLRVGGKIITATTEPVLDLTISAEKFDSAAVYKDSPVAGALSFDAAVTGTVSQPAASGEVRLDQGRINGYSVNNAVAKFNYYDNILTINQYDATMFGGHIAAAGNIIARTKQFNCSIRGRGLQMAALPGLPTGLSGCGDVDLTVQGAESITAANISGNFKIGAGTALGISFRSFAGCFSKNGDQIKVDYLTAGFATGSLTAGGTIENGRLNLTVFGQGVPLNNLMASQQQFLAGAAECEGVITGTEDDPLLTVRVKAYNGQAYYQPFSLAQGYLTVNKRMVTLTDVEAVNGATTHRISGTIGLTGPHNLDITIVTRKARAENLVRLIMPGEKITGNVDNDIIISGPAANFVADGKVTLTEGSFRGQLISKVAGSYHHQGGTTELNDFIIESANAEIRLGGKIDAKGRLDIDVEAKDIDMAALNYNYPYPVAGRAKFTGKLTGTSALPVFNGEIAADVLKLNNQELQNITGKISVNGPEISIPEFSFAQNGGKFSFAGGINTRSGSLNGNVNAESGDVASLLAMLNVSAKAVEGRLDGHVIVAGTLDNPYIGVTGTLTKGKIKNYPLDNIVVDVVLQNNVVTINKFQGNQGAGILVAQGTANLHGALNLEIGGRNIDAGLLTAWFDSSVETKGQINFAAQVSGTVQNPSAAVSLEIKQGSVANATFDSLYGLFVIDDNSITVNQLMLIKGPYRASAYGKVPLAALSKQGRDKATVADQMDLKVRLDKANLSILPLLTKEVSWAAGETTGAVTVAGTLAQPLLYGKFTVQNGTVKLASLGDPIQKVGVDIQFEGDKIDIKTCEGSMGAGTYRLTGNAALHGLALENYNILLVLDKLGVNNKYFKGPLTGTLVLASDGGKQTLSGKVVLENVTADIPTIPEFAPSDMDMGLDVEIVAGDKVRLYNPYMYDLKIDGRMKIAGNTRRPDVSGKFGVVRGTVSYLRTQFKVESGSAEFTQFRSFMPIIHLKAETNLESTKVYLAADGPPNAMEFHLTSMPTMNQQELLLLLTMRSNYLAKNTSSTGLQNNNLGRDEALGLLNAGLTMGFLTETESMFRDSLGLTDFRLVRGTLPTDIDFIIPSQDINVNDQGNYSLAISKYVNDRLLLSYTQGVNHQGHSISFRYDLSRRLSVTGLQDEQNKVRFGVETRFNF